MENHRTLVRRLLQTGETEELVQWLGNARNPFRILISLIFDSEPIVCYGAVRFIGFAAGIEAVKDLEMVRRLVRRFLWMMNDESGNVTWKAPETIGEILHNVPRLIVEYGHLLSSFLDQDPFRKGARIAISRIGAKDSSCFDEPTIRKLTGSLEDEGAEIRATSLLALKALGVNIPDSSIERLLSDQAGIEYYDFDKGEMIRATVGDLAKLL
jgi:hypothetical protein